MHLSQERQAGCGLPFQQHYNERKFSPRVHPFVERFIIFGHLPLADARWTDQQNETGRISDFLRKLRRPGAAGSEVRRSEECAGSGILAFDRGFEPLRKRLVRRMVAEKPALHSMAPGWQSCTRAARNATGPLVQESVAGYRIVRDQSLQG